MGRKPFFFMFVLSRGFDSVLCCMYVLPMTQLLFFGIMFMIAYGFIGRIKQ